MFILRIKVLKSSFTKIKTDVILDPLFIIQIINVDKLILIIFSKPIIVEVFSLIHKDFNSDTYINIFSKILVK